MADGSECYAKHGACVGSESERIGLPVSTEPGVTVETEGNGIGLVKAT